MPRYGRTSPHPSPARAIRISGSATPPRSLCLAPRRLLQALATSATLVATQLPARASSIPTSPLPRTRKLRNGLIRSSVQSFSMCSTRRTSVIQTSPWAIPALAESPARVSRAAISVRHGRFSSHSSCSSNSPSSKKRGRREAALFFSKEAFSFAAARQPPQQSNLPRMINIVKGHSVNQPCHFFSPAAVECFLDSFAQPFVLAFQDFSILFPCRFRCFPFFRPRKEITPLQNK